MTTSWFFLSHHFSWLNCICQENFFKNIGQTTKDKTNIEKLLIWYFGPNWVALTKKGEYRRHLRLLPQCSVPLNWVTPTHASDEKEFFLSPSSLKRPEISGFTAMRSWRERNTSGLMSVSSSEIFSCCKKEIQIRFGDFILGKTLWVTPYRKIREDETERTHDSDTQACEESYKCTETHFCWQFQQWGKWKFPAQMVWARYNWPIGLYSKHHIVLLEMSMQWEASTFWKCSKSFLCLTVIVNKRDFQKWKVG